MDWVVEPRAWVAFVTLVALELVLGVDNVIFISILAGKLPRNRQRLARRAGLTLAVFSRILLLFCLSWIVGLTEPLFSILGFEVSGRDVVLFLGGLFLLGKATIEIHQKLEGVPGHASARVRASFAGVMLQVVLLDVVFSLDSVITAVGMVDEIGIMVAAVVVAALAMIALADAVGEFVNRHPTVKMLALVVPSSHRLHARGRESPPAHPEGVRLLRHGLFRFRGGAQPSAAQAAFAGRPPRTLHRGASLGLRGSRARTLPATSEHGPLPGERAGSCGRRGGCVSSQAEGGNARVRNRQVRSS
ncbi:MAG: hypothetical protein KatS3mg076_2541 [Candidatus Binatia bacterium]|nr:MAG: hypothetical protein KatS3mg076_2541 [Candidatus Binatia bacterium]